MLPNFRWDQIQAPPAAAASLALTPAFTIASLVLDKGLPEPPASGEESLDKI